MDDRLFDIESVPEVPLLKEARRVRAARGVALDARFLNDYPPEWNKCSSCAGYGFDAVLPSGTLDDHADRVLEARRKHPCLDCLGMGSLKAKTRLLEGFRCERCHHPFIPKGDAKILGVDPGTVPWSPCDEKCAHGGTVRFRQEREPVPLVEREWFEDEVVYAHCEPDWIASYLQAGFEFEAKWRILTVHHLDGDKANCAWWNLAVLCQRCHLEIQAKIVMERIYPHPHSEWFKPHAAGYYAHVYLCKTCGGDMTWQHPRGFPYPHPSKPQIPLARVESLGGPDGYPHLCEPGLEVTRDEAVECMDFLLALELA